MHKPELIEAVMNKAELNKKTATAAVEAVLASVTDALHSGDDVTLIGFGTFKVIERSEREGHNPRTGEKIILPASKSVSFKVGKGLKEAVNN